VAIAYALVDNAVELFASKVAITCPDHELAIRVTLKGFPPVNGGWCAASDIHLKGLE
jgi:hypothetical protein